MHHFVVEGHALEGVTEPPEWMARAECAGANVHAFYPEGGVRPPSEVLEMCSRCAVRQPCLEYAIANDERWGVWGGLTQGQLRKLRRARRRESAGASMAPMPSTDNGTAPTEDLPAEWPESPAEELAGIEGPANDQDERRCPMCGKELPTTDSRRVYCSRTCRNRAGEVARGRRFEPASPQLATVLDAMLATGAEVTTTVAGFTLTARRG